MSERGSAALAWSTAALSLAFFFAGNAVGYLAPFDSRLRWGPFSPQSVVMLPYAAVGAIVAARRPGNPIGWIFCAMGLAGEVSTFAQSYARFAQSAGLAVEPLGWLINVWVVSFGLAPLLLLLFPDGRLLSRQLRPIVWLTPLYVAVGLVSASFEIGTTILRPSLLTAVFGDAAGGAIARSGPPVFGVTFLASFAVGAVALLVRLRRAHGDERLQLKWFAYAGACLVVVATVLSVIYASPARESLDPNAPNNVGLFGGIPFGFAWGAVPVAAGIAILRYRLYDIDLLINRTLVYAALTASVVGIYVLVVGSLGALFQTTGDLASALLATALVAVLFEPLRERLQRGVNRLLYGRRDEPYAVLTQLGRRLEETLTPDAALTTVVESLREAFGLPYAAIALTREEGPAVAASSGAEVADVLRLPLLYKGETLGELALSRRAPGESFTSADRRLLDDLARHAGAAAHAVRLTADLQRSRERLVTAREEERRRLRRDLHDGLGAQLAALSLQAGMLRGALAHDPAAADAVVELQQEIRAAIANIRRLVYELRPPSLDELGLVAALEEQAARCSAGGGVVAPGPGDGEASQLQVHVEAPERLLPLPAAVEVAAYRIAQEALTNVVRHAAARNCVVSLAVEDELRLSISDDGVGLPAGIRTGVGLVSMRERAAEVGGTCVVAPRPHGGTDVVVRLPLPKG